MKRLLSLLFAFITIYLPCNAQESSLPTFDTEISREVGFFDIECNIYHNVTVNLKATKSDFFSNKSKVKVTVYNIEGKKIYKKTFKGAYLYLYSNGQIQVGKPKFNQLIISKHELNDKTYIGMIREKEGVY